MKSFRFRAFLCANVTLFAVLLVPFVASAAGVIVVAITNPTNGATVSLDELFAQEDKIQVAAMASAGIHDVRVWGFDRATNKYFLKHKKAVYNISNGKWEFNFDVRDVRKMREEGMTSALFIAGARDNSKPRMTAYSDWITVNLVNAFASVTRDTLLTAAPSAQSIVGAALSEASAETSILTVTRSGTGTGYVLGWGINCGYGGSTDCSETYSLATTTPTISLYAAPLSASSTFVGWTGCDSVSGNTCTVTMSTNKTVNAKFDAVLLMQLQVQVNGGYDGYVTGTGISCGAGGRSDCFEVYSVPTSVALTANPMTNSKFDGWSGCDSVSGTTCTVNISSNRTVQANFSPLPPAIAPAPVLRAISKTGNSAVGNSSLTLYHTNPIGFTNNVLVVAVNTRALENIVNVSYTANGVRSLAKALSNDCGGTGDQKIEVWYLINPVLGVKGYVHVQYDGAVGPEGIFAMMYSGADQTNPLGNLKIGCGNGNYRALSLTTEKQNSVVFGFVNGRGGGNEGAYVVSDGFTKLADVCSGTANISDDCYAVSNKVVGMAGIAQEVKFTGRAVNNWALSAVELKPAPVTTVQTMSPYTASVLDSLRAQIQQLQRLLDSLRR